MQGDAVPLPEREVSSHHPLLFPGPPQAARERDLNSYEKKYKRSPDSRNSFQGLTMTRQLFTAFLGCVAKNQGEKQQTGNIYYRSALEAVEMTQW